MTICEIFNLLRSEGPVRDSRGSEFARRVSGKIRDGILEMDKYVERADSSVGNSLYGFVSENAKIMVLAGLSYAALC